ncbi:hypothetical protein UQW22_03470 [Isoptericola halotolerans]|uniref:hypothetical protein n=1 Tax=Isoptericola halotolerans TaxID=300560 RepID=UPI003890FB66
MGVLMWMGAVGCSDCGVVASRDDADDSRRAVVTSLGVDEHAWHLVDPRALGLRERTGMVDEARNPTEELPARLTCAINADDAHGEAFVAWQRTQLLQAAYRSRGPVGEEPG